MRRHGQFWVNKRRATPARSTAWFFLHGCNHLAYNIPAFLVFVYRCALFAFIKRTTRNHGQRCVLFLHRCDLLFQLSNLCRLHGGRACVLHKLASFCKSQRADRFRAVGCRRADIDKHECFRVPAKGICHELGQRVISVPSVCMCVCFSLRVSECVCVRERERERDLCEPRPFSGIVCAKRST
mgnify:CR=1 FL=1|jgi:hypothetical protein